MSVYLLLCLYGRLLDQRRSASENAARLAWVRERAAEYMRAGDERSEALSRAWAELGDEVPGGVG